MHDEDEILEHEAETAPRPVENIEMWELHRALCRLTHFPDDPYLTIQATNIALIDRWLMEIEAGVLKRLLDEERTPIDDATFLSAQTQMWLFAIYEILRTWRQRAKETLRLAQNGGLKLKIESAFEKGLPGRTRV